MTEKVNDLERTRQILAGITTGAGNSPQTGQSGSTGSPASNQTPDVVLLPERPSNGGGGGNNNPPGGHGGGSRDNGGSTNKKSWFANLSVTGTLLLGLAVMILLSIVGNFLSIGTVAISSSYMTPAIEGQIAVVQKLKELEEAPKKVTVEVPTETVRSRITLMTFNCTTEELRDKVFEGGNVQKISDKNTSYELTPGCAIVQADSRINNLSGENYLLSKVDPASPTGFTGCGTIGGLSNQSQECVTFLNAHKGQRLRTTIANGGYININ